MLDSPDTLIEQYLDRLREVTVALPRQTRNEPLLDVSEHLEAGMEGRPRTVVEVRNLLDELGSPEQIAAAARDQLTVVTDPSRASNGAPPTVAFLLPLAAVPLIWIVWPVGALCLWLSDAWTTRQKWLGTLVFPGGLWLAIWAFYWSAVLAPVRETCSGGSVNGQVLQISCSPPQWGVPVVVDVLLVALLVVLLGPIAVAIYLGVVLIRRRSLPASPA